MQATTHTIIPPRPRAGLGTARLALTQLQLTSRAHDGLGGPRAEPYILFVFFSFDGAEIKVPLAVTPAEVPGLIANLANLKDRILDTPIQIDATPHKEGRPTPNKDTDASRNTFSGKDKKFKKGDKHAIPANQLDKDGNPVLDAGGNPVPLGRFDVPLVGFKIKVEIVGLSDPILLTQLQNAVNGLLPQLPVPPPVVGVLYVLMERDISNAITIAAGHAAFNNEVFAVLDGFGASISGAGITLRQAQADPDLIRKKVEDQAKEAALKSVDVGSAINADDTIAVAQHVFLSTDLASPQIPDTFDTRDTKHGSWEVTIETQLLPG